MSRGRKRRWRAAAANLALVVVTLVLALGVGEIAFRAFDPTGAERLIPHRLLTRHDPLLGWSKIPGKTGRHVTSEYEITEHINSRGIRGPEYPYEKGENEFRVLILGDSFAEGYTVPFEQLFSEVMERALDTGPDRRYEVINAGTGGYSTDQELLFFRHEGKRYAPDLTILTFVVNDVWYNQSPDYWRGAKPMFELGDAGLTLTNVPVPAPRESALARAVGWLKEHVHLYAAFQQAAGNLTSLRAAAAKLGLHEASRNTEGMPLELLVFEKPADARIERGWAVTEALIRQLRDETAAIGSRLLVLYVPPDFDIHPEQWPATRRRYGLSAETWRPDWPAIELAAICDRLAIPCIDPTPAFRKAADQLAGEGRRLYFPRDGHWTAEGHALAGQILADWVATHASR